MKAPFTALVSGVISLAYAPTAGAFCNTTNCRDSSCVPLAAGAVCEHDEHPLAWAEPTIAYAFSQRPDGRLEATLSDEQIRRLTAESLLTWSEVQCAEGPTPVQFLEIAETSTARETSFDDGTNVIAFLTPQEWRSYPCDTDPSIACGLDEEAFALTDVFFTPSTGQIRGVDMVVNGLRGPYTECPEPDGCTPNQGTDLKNVLTHEAGHMLGLSHSEQPEATMFARALPEEIKKRSLHPDDVVGLCALYPPGQNGNGDGGGGDGGGGGRCSVSSIGARRDGGAAVALGGLAIAALWLSCVRARRLRRA